MSLLALLLFQSAATERAASPCDEPLAQHQMNVCAYEEYQAADVKLNAQWTITHNHMKSLDKDIDDGRIGHAEALLKAQRDWIAYRDSHCLTEAYRARGGTLEPLLRYGCLEAETKRRTEALAELIIEG